MYGPTRTRATWKPRVGEGDLAFFETDDGVLALGLHGARSGRYDGTDRSNVFSPDYLLIDGKETMEFAETAPDAERFHIGFDIVGGFENNAIRVFWPDDEHPRWIALKTFTGFQVKYPQPGKRPPSFSRLPTKTPTATATKPLADDARSTANQGSSSMRFTREQASSASP